MPINAFATWMDVCQQKGYWYVSTMPSPVPRFDEHYTGPQFADAIAETARILKTPPPNWRMDELLSKLYEWPN